MGNSAVLSLYPNAEGSIGQCIRCKTHLFGPPLHAPPFRRSVGSRMYGNLAAQGKPPSKFCPNRGSFLFLFWAARLRRARLAEKLPRRAAPWHARRRRPVTPFTRANRRSR